MDKIEYKGLTFTKVAGNWFVSYKNSSVGNPRGYFLLEAAKYDPEVLATIRAIEYSKLLSVHG